MATGQPAVTVLKKEKHLLDMMRKEKEIDGKSRWSKRTYISSGVENEEGIMGELKMAILLSTISASMLINANDL